MDLRFIGQSDSMGLKFGQIYRVSVKPYKSKGVMMTVPVHCPYDTQEGFWRNWAHPREELRTVMEARGRELREFHIHRDEFNVNSYAVRQDPVERFNPVKEVQSFVTDELPTLPCSKTSIHGSHNYETLSTKSPYAWCPGKTTV